MYKKKCGGAHRVHFEHSLLHDSVTTKIVIHFEHNAGPPLKLSWSVCWTQKLNHRDSNGAHTLQSKVELQKLWNRSFLPCPPLWSPFFLCGYCASEVSFSPVVTGHLWSPFCRELWCWCTALSTKVLVLVIYTIKMISTSFLDCQETCRMRFSRIFINPSQESTHPSLSGYQVPFQWNLPNLLFKIWSHSQLFPLIWPLRTFWVNHGADRLSDQSIKW